MRFLISAGEASGEFYGVGLMSALKRLDPGAEFFGVGGEAMRRAGCDTVADARQLSVVGIVEVLSHLPGIWREFRKLVREADRRKPDAAIVIDSPAFNFRVAKDMHARGVPVIYYVVPQLWAWREQRVKRFHQWIKKALVIFPFEEQWYRERGVDAEYVGYPLAEVPPPSLTREEFATRNKLDARKPWIALLPGSRKKEFRMNVPAILRLPRELGSGYEYIIPLAPGLEPSLIRERAPDSLVILRANAPETLAFSRAAVVASGTATVQAALAGVPFVIVYCVSPLTWTLGRHLLKVPHVGMPNLIAGERVVPELIQHDYTSAKVAAALTPLLADGPARERMLASLQQVRQRLRGNDPAAKPAFDRAAEAVMKALT
jgi:lipid-A-disaccharide synthase